MPEPTAAAAVALLASIKEIISDVYFEAKSSAKKITPKVLNEIQADFRALIIESYQRRSKVKTIIDPHVSLHLKDVYVPTNLVHAEKVVSQEVFFSVLETKKRAVIVGTAGAGKSLFLRTVMLHVMDFWAGPIPIFVELRSLNDRPAKADSLEQLVLSSVTAHVRNFSIDRLRHALFTGKFMLILDALDEVEHSRKESVAKQIVRLADRNQKCTVVVSSRPDDLFQSWEQFDVFKMQGLSKESCAALVQKLSYPQINDIKEKFLSEIVESSYSKHREFLSVPLLLVMMLLVYRNFVEVPDKIINFYKRAFETLFYGHDAMKGETGLKRSTRSQLAFEDFLRTFSAFCAASYSSGKATFEPEVAEAIAAKAIKLSDVGCTEKEFVADLQEAVCVLQRDGTELSFVHRSFQEYFAAAYFVRVEWPLERRIQLLNKSGYRLAGNVSGMMRELDPGAFERNWLLAAADELIASVERAISQNSQFSPATVIAAELVEFVYRDVQSSTRWTMGMSHARMGLLWDFVARWGKAYGVNIADVFSMVEVLAGERDRLAPFKDGQQHKNGALGFKLRPVLSAEYEALFAGSAVEKTLLKEFARMSELRDAIRASLKERDRREVDLFA